jgi:hypothetical protein
MKKIVTIAAACMISAAAFGQVKFGIKAGGNMSREANFYFGNMLTDKTVTIDGRFIVSGLHIGAYANYSFSDVIGAQAEVLFSIQNGRNSAGGKDFYQLQQLSFINLPLLLDIKPFERPFSVLVGPQFSVCVNRSFSHKEWYGGDVNYNDFDAAIVLGA